MNGLIDYLFTVQRGLVQIIFPNVCICCGQQALDKTQHICSFCLDERFEEATFKDDWSTGGVILPNNVNMQYALWTFDKGGLLQELMHNLKYERLTAIGYQLGKKLARRSHSLPVFKTALPPVEDVVLVPVPLHYLKFRKRGFNQAFSIAKGIREVIAAPICSIDAVRRTKFTQSQTGFTLEKRIDNMQDAFSVTHADQIRHKTVVIVDDVFTTGATSFELARALTNAGAASVMIWTIAQA